MTAAVNALCANTTGVLRTWRAAQGLGEEQIDRVHRRRRPSRRRGRRPRAWPLEQQAGHEDERHAGETDRQGDVHDAVGRLAQHARRDEGQVQRRQIREEDGHRHARVADGEEVHDEVHRQATLMPSTRERAPGAAQVAPAAA